MPPIATHITELIKQHDCVIVPGLGGFVTYRDSARIVDNTIQPPTTRIRFNHLLKYNDGLLCERYMTSDHMSYTEASRNIATEVNNIKSELYTNYKFSLGSLGTLQLHADGSMSLDTHDVSFLPENFGLHTIYINPINNNQAETTERTIVLRIPHRTADILRYAAAIAIITLTAFLIPNQSNHTSHEASIHFDSLRNTIQTSSNTPTQQFNNTTDNINSQITIDATDTHCTPHTQNTTPSEHTGTNTALTLKQPDNQTKTSTIPTTSEGRYHMIVASLATAQLAQQYIDSQNEYDKTTLRIISDGNRHRISAHRFKSYRQAIDYIDSLRTDNTDNKAWILCTKDKKANP